VDWRCGSESRSKYWCGWHREPFHVTRRAIACGTLIFTKRLLLLNDGASRLETEGSLLQNRTPTCYICNVDFLTKHID
jgi:hypothetical protein